MSKRSSPKKKKTARAYDNTLRAEQSQRTQQLVLETMVALLVERRGADVQIQEIAKKSGVSERSIFRLFKDRQAMLAAIDSYVTNFIQTGVAKLQDKGIIEFTKELFALFDKNENMVIAYLYSPFGRQARAILRRKLNKFIIDKLLDGAPAPSTQDFPKYALIAAMINARLWDDMRTDFNLKGEEIGETVAWAIRTLSAKLK